MLDVVRSLLLCPWGMHDYVIFVWYLMSIAYLPPPLNKLTYYFFSAIVPKSNFMFFLDVDPEEAYKRTRESCERQERFESLEELNKVRLKVLHLALLGKWIVVDANKSVKEVAKQIRKAHTQTLEQNMYV
jgi:dTMP kinase